MILQDLDSVKIGQVIRTRIDKREADIKNQPKLEQKNKKFKF